MLRSTRLAGACVLLSLSGGCSWFAGETLVEAEAPAASSAEPLPETCRSDCTTHCSSTPGSGCSCSQSCSVDHDRTMSCDAATCVCMLDDREVFSFAAGQTCASDGATREAFSERCGAVSDDAASPR